MPQSLSGDLKSGAYVITSCATNLPIARKNVEDKQVIEDLYTLTEPRPVRVVTVPEDSHDLGVRFTSYSLMLYPSCTNPHGYPP